MIFFNLLNPVGFRTVHSGGDIYTVFDEESDFQIENEQFRRQSTNIWKNLIFPNPSFLYLSFSSSPGSFGMIPGSEPVQFDMEKLFLLSVSKENLDCRGQIRKTYPIKISENFKKFLI